MAFAYVIARDPAKAVTPIFLMLFIIFLLLSSYECWFLTYELNISLFFNKIASEIILNKTALNEINNNISSLIAENKNNDILNLNKNIQLLSDNFDFLSDASKISLKLQGGVLNDKESKKFENKSYFTPSILLRKFDEAAKRTDIKIR